jgi:hypothetical protein
MIPNVRACATGNLSLRKQSLALIAATECKLSSRLFGRLNRLRKNSNPAKNRGLCIRAQLYRLRKNLNSAQNMKALYQGMASAVPQTQPNQRGL